MYVYTVKLVLEQSIHKKFIDYLYNTHQPDLIKTGCFLSSTLEVDTNNGEVMARYQCESTEMFEHYIKEYADNLRIEVMQLFPNGIVSAERNFCKIVSNI